LTVAVEDAVTADEDVSQAVTIIDDAPRTSKTILEEADLNKDGVLDLTEASEYLIFDGKLHIEVKIDLVFVVVLLSRTDGQKIRAKCGPQKLSKWPAKVFKMARKPKTKCVVTLE